MRRFPLLAMALIAAPALAVGIGPLKKEGVTDGERKAFWLTVTNPARTSEMTFLSAKTIGDWRPDARVRIIPDKMLIAPQRTRRVLVIANSLVPGETYSFRVCAEGAPKPQEIIHARVCSKLTARRVRRPV